MSQPKLDWDAIRQQLSQRGGKAFWRSLEEVAQGEEFYAFLQHEFPRELMSGTFISYQGVDRRT